MYSTGSTNMLISLSLQVLAVVLVSLHVHVAHGFRDSGYTGSCRRNTLANAPLFDRSNSEDPDAESKSSITAELFEDDETLRAREISDSFAKAKAAVVPDASRAKEEEVRAEDDAGALATMVIDKQAKEELDELKFQVGKIDEERVQQLEAKEAEMQRMKFSILELKENVADSERKANEAAKTIKRLQTMGEGAKEENKGLISRIKEKFRKEKDDLTNEISNISEQLQQEKDKAAKELSEAKESAGLLEQQLKKEVAQLESELEAKEKSLADASKEAREMKKQNRAELNLQMKEASRLQQASDRIAAQDKRRLRNNAWGLQSALDDAKYDLMMAQKETGKLKAERVGMEDRLLNMQKEMMNAIAEAKSQLEADKIQMKKDVISAIASSKTEKYEALRLTGIKYDALVAMNARKLEEAQEDAEAQVRFARQEMKVRMKDTQKMHEREALAMKERHQVEIVKIKAGATSKVNEMKKTLRGVEDDLARQEAMVAMLQQERKSFRNIGKMTFQLVKQRTSRVRDRIVNKIARRKIE